MIQKIENKPLANLIISEYSVQTTGNALKKWTACEKLRKLNLYEKDKSTFDLFMMMMMSVSGAFRWFMHLKVTSYTQEEFKWQALGLFTIGGDRQVCLFDDFFWVKQNEPRFRFKSSLRQSDPLNKRHQNWDELGHFHTKYLNRGDNTTVKQINTVRQDVKLQWALHKVE